MKLNCLKFWCTMALMVTLIAAMVMIVNHYNALH
jgi:hypothetical protein